MISSIINNTVSFVYYRETFVDFLFTCLPYVREEPPSLDNNSSEKNARQTLHFKENLCPLFSERIFTNSIKLHIVMSDCIRKCRGLFVKAQLN